MRALESSLLAKVPGIAHGFGTAHDPAPEKWRSQWEATRPEWKQVHGVGVARVAGPRQACGEVDALWTDAPESWIGVATADCVPILLADREGRAVAAIHAGWRGTLARIAKPVLLQMERAGYSADNLVAAIGPSIRSCCFEVGEDLVENFVTEFPQIPQDLLNPRHRHLDLVAGLEEKLLVIVRFLAVLELYKQGIVDIEQFESFGELKVRALAAGERVALDLSSLDEWGDDEPSYPTAADETMRHGEADEDDGEDDADEFERDDVVDDGPMLDATGDEPTVDLTASVTERA